MDDRLQALKEFARHKPECATVPRACDDCCGVGGFDGLDSDCRTCRGAGKVSSRGCTCGLDALLRDLQVATPQQEEKEQVTRVGESAQPGEPCTAAGNETK